MPSLGDSLGARGLRLPFDVTGRIAPVSRTVIAEDDFSSGMAGFTHLWTPGEASNCGASYWINRGGTPRAVVRANTQVGGLAMAIKRMANLFGNGRYLLEMVISRETLNLSPNYPRAYGIGLDMALEDGTRRFFQMRYLNYDETAGAPAGRWLVDMGPGYTGGITSTGAPNGRFVELPGGGAATWPVNENKALPFYFALEIDTANGLYLGFRFGNALRRGSLAATPDNSLAGLGQMNPEALTSFNGGANTCFSVENRASGTKTKGQLAAHFHRITFLGA